MKRIYVIVLSIVVVLTVLIAIILRKGAARKRELEPVSFLSGVYIELVAYHERNGEFPEALLPKGGKSQIVSWTDSEAKKQFVRDYNNGKIDYSPTGGSEGYTHVILRWRLQDKVLTLDSAGGVRSSAKDAGQ